MTRTFKQLAEGAAIPRCYGVAYILPYSGRVVLAPLGLHLIVGAVRAFYFWLIQTRVVEAWEGYSAYQYQKGFAAGNKHGYENGIRHAKMWFERHEP